MGKYSSDSDGEKRSGRKHKRSNSRRSSSPDSGDRYRRKKDKKSDRHRSRSRDRYSRSRRSRSTSSHRSHKSKRRRSDSRERSRHRSKDHHRRSRSKDKYHRSRRSRSRSYIKEYTSKPKRRTSSSDSSSTDSSRSSTRTATKIVKEKTVSAQSAIVIRDDDEPVVMDEKALEEIERDGFAQKQFSSSNKKVPDNIVIDLKKQTIKVPAVEPTEPDTIFHHNLFLNEEARVEKWVKELYSFRHKALLK